MFPTLELPTQEGKIRKISFANSKYTLIDFWYSHCGPCIAEFPELKRIYNNYRKTGFVIIGISTDKESDKSDWLKAIKKYGLSWSQVWDINGSEASALFINSFPTTFLIDKSGKILYRNIALNKLEDFLEKEMKHN